MINKEHNLESKVVTCNINNRTNNRAQKESVNKTEFLMQLLVSKTLTA
jgi:hypothetical protein